ncbi:MAG: glycosyltransferase family 39 protein, partial [Microcystis sp. M53600_WE12]|nr:glycosyltransferase family 39 protein [Microcystis sp. M53600_WE12]
MHYIPSFKKFQIAVPDILVVAVCIVSFIFSVIESKLNTDAHHWGLMYANAIDLVRGSIPFKEIFIQYGILTTIIQGFSLVIFGNKAISIGIITGLFYSCSLYISYLLWQKIIGKNLASFSTILMFLLHGYIIYPWSNYFSYTFLLICLLLLSNGRSKNSPILVYGVAGIFFALNVLSRQTAFSPTIVPIYLYFLLELVKSSKEERKT